MDPLRGGVGAGHLPGVVALTVVVMMHGAASLVLLWRNHEMRVGVVAIPALVHVHLRVGGGHVVV